MLILAATGWAAGSDDFASSGYARGAAEYLRLPLTAQSAGVGGAMTAWKYAAAGAQYNPALFDAIEDGTAVAAGGYGIESLDRNYMGAVIGLPIGGFLVAGLCYIRTGVDAMDGRDSSGAGTGLFSYSANAATLSVAGRLPGKISAGASARYIGETMADEKANGIGFDLGASWQPVPMLCIGASAGNLLSRLWWSTGSDDVVLPTVRLGVNLSVLDSLLIAEVDIIKSDWQPVECAAGLQYEIAGMAFLRAGITADIDYSNKSVSPPIIAFGAGFRYVMMKADYACLIPSGPAYDLFGLEHRISISAILRY